MVTERALGRDRVAPVSEMGRRERKKLATRRALEDAAFTLFRERGYDATPVDAISDAADVSARTFFRYFPTKDDVLFGDHEPRMDALRTFLADRPASEPVLDSVAAFVRFLVTDTRDNRERVLLQTRIAAEKVHVLGVFRQQHDEQLSLLADFIATRIGGEDRADFRARAVAGAAMAAFLAAASQWARGGAEADLSALGELAIEAVSATLRLPQTASA